MRKHRLYGVVLAMLLGTGVVTQLPNSQHDYSFKYSFKHSSKDSDHRLARFDASPESPRDAATELPRDSLMSLGLPLTLSEAQPTPPVPAPSRGTGPAPVADSAPAPSPTPAPAQSNAPADGVWAELRHCESDDNYADDTGNGYYGAYQFSLATWESLGFSGLPSGAAPAEQDTAAEELQARSGWGQWPACASELGLV